MKKASSTKVPARLKRLFDIASFTELFTILPNRDDAVAAAKQAVELQPGDAETHHFYARCLVWAGFADQACDETKIALRLDPETVQGPYLNSLGRSEFAAGRYAESMNAFARHAAHGGPSYLGNLVLWAAACSLSGNMGKARELIREMLQEKPDLCLENMSEVRHYVSESELEIARRGLREAGLPQ